MHFLFPFFNWPRNVLVPCYLDFEEKVRSKRNDVIRMGKRSASWWQQLNKLWKKAKSTNVLCIRLHRTPKWCDFSKDAIWTGGNIVAGEVIKTKDLRDAKIFSQQQGLVFWWAHPSFQNSLLRLVFFKAPPGGGRTLMSLEARTDLKIRLIWD